MNLRFLKPTVLFVLILALVVTTFNSQIYAGPYFYLDANPWYALYQTPKALNLYLYTDGETLTAAQAVINFDSDVLSSYSVSPLNSKCSFWAPADPSLGFGNNATPYFTGGNKAVFSCGFSNPGYQSASGSADLIGRIVVTPQALGLAQLTFSNTRAMYIGSDITMSNSPTYDLGIYYSTSSGLTSLDPNSTPTPTSSTSTSSAYAYTPTPRPADLTADDLNFVEISQNSGSGTSTTTTGTDTSTSLTATERDDTIPAPPANLERRPSATPFVFKLLNQITDSTQPQTQQQPGDILSAQSLRELLIPGKSKADKTVVMINLISTLTFITLLAIVIWRLISISRMNRLKSSHMKELLTSELAAIESKIGVLDDDDGGEQLKEELNQTVKRISDEMGSKK